MSQAGNVVSNNLKWFDFGRIKSLNIQYRWDVGIEVIIDSLELKIRKVMEEWKKSIKEALEELKIILDEKNKLKNQFFKFWQTQSWQSKSKSKSAEKTQNVAEL